MSESSHLIRPMEGGGAYNRNSRVQAAGLQPAIGLFRAAAEAVPLAGPVTIADYGASAGRNSLAPIAAALAAVRARIGPGPAVSVVHTDLPDNDFSALFRTIAEDPDSYVWDDPAVFPLAVGRCFYGQILPAGSVTLGWSSWAVQWLSRLPAEIPDHVQVALSADAAACAAFAQQAAEDWSAFLAARSRELAPGGRLVILTMAIDDAGAFGYGPLLKAMVASLRDMVSAGAVPLDAFRRMAVPTIGRTRAAFMAPFAAGEVPELVLADLDLFHAEDRIWAQFQQDGDAAAYGARWAAFSRASVVPTLAAELDGGEAVRSAFMDRLDADMSAHLAAAPEPTLIPLARMTILKDAAAGS